MERAIDNCVSESLGRLRVIRVKSRYRYWALALRALSYPLRMSDEDGKGPDEGMESLGLICLDGLSNCFWPEKYSEEEKSSGTGKKRGMGILGVKGIEDIGMRDIMVTIGNLRKELGCVIFSTTQGLWVSTKLFQSILRNIVTGRLISGVERKERGYISTYTLFRIVPTCSLSLSMVYPTW